MKAAFLLHGYATTVDDFKSLLPFLEKNYDYIVLEDLPGHGKDGDPNCFTVDMVMDYVYNRYDEIAKKYDHIDVYGFSMGGALATSLASNRKIDNLVLLAPANAFLNIKGFFGRAKKEISNYFTELDEETQSKKEVKKINGKRSRDMALRNLLPNYNIYSAITFARIIRRCNISLKENNTRTLLLVGDYDQLVPLKVVSVVSNYFKNIESEVIPYMSHLMLYSRNYRMIVKRISQFIEKG